MSWKSLFWSVPVRASTGWCLATSQTPMFQFKRKLLLPKVLKSGLQQSLWNCLEPVFVAEPNPLLNEFCIHHILENGVPNCVPTPRSCLVLCPFQNLRKTRTPPGSQMLCFAFRVIFLSEYRNMKQGKKVCKATAIRCYQAFSLRLLRLLWTLHIMSNSAPVSFQTLPGSLSYTCQG